MSQPIWNTTQGSIGSYPAQIAVSPIQLSASAVPPATTVTYQLISGSLPSGLSLSSAGLITGTPGLVVSDTTYTFVIRATDNLSNTRDRTFSMLIFARQPIWITNIGSLGSYPALVNITAGSFVIGEPYTITTRSESVV
jgi:hypothetical protein